MPNIFQSSEPSEDVVFVAPDEFGTGSEVENDFIATRTALIGDHSEMLKSLAVAQQNVLRLDRPNMRSYIDGMVAKGLDTVALNSLEAYGSKDDLVGGANDLKKIREVAAEPDEVRKLAAAAPKYLDQFEQYSIAREIARRDYTMMLFSKRLEQAGILPDTIWKKTVGIAGTLIPGRQMIQLGFSKFDGDAMEEAIKRLHGQTDEEFFKQLPDIMDSMVEQSGGNPFYFLERMQAFLDPDDVLELKAFMALDVIDAASIAAVAPRLLRMAKLARATNTPIKLLRDTGQTKKAAELNVAAAGDEAAAQTTKTAQADAAQNMSPFQGEGIDPDLTNGLAPESQALVAQRRAEVQKELAPLHDANFLIRRTSYTQAEIDQANAKYLAQFGGDARIVEQGTDGFVAEVSIQKPQIWPNAETIDKKILELQDTKAALKQMLANAKDKKGRGAQARLLKESIDQTREELVRYQDIRNRLANQAGDMGPVRPRPVEVRRVRVAYRLNDYGQLDAIDYGWWKSRHLNSPSTYIDQMMPSYVEDATLTDFDVARVNNQMQRAKQAAISGLSKQSRANLDSILLQGDRDQVIYSATDLVNGVRTPDGLIKLESAEEVGSYYAIRDVFEDLYKLKNVELKRQLEAGGYKALHLDVENQQLNFANPDKNLSLDKINDIQRIYDMNSGQVVDTARLRSDPSSVMDNQILELKYPLEVGEEIVNYVITPRSRLKELPQVVLARRNGYVPKIDKDVFWVAEMIGDKLVNGRIKPNFRTTVRYFDNPKDAREWSAAQLRKGQTVEVRSGREWLDASPGRREEFEANIFGGLYGGKRGERPVPFGLDGTEAERVGGIEAMEAYMNHIASRMPAVNFRMSLIQRFLNSAKNPLTGESYLVNPGDWRSEIRSTIDHKHYSGLKAMQDWVSDQLRIPTTEERLWGNVSQKLAELISRAPGKAGRKLSRWSMQMGAKDLFTRLRGMSFHATLGWFNPSQFFVQSMGMSLAMSINPAKAPLYLARSLALRASMFEVSKSDDALRVAARAAFLPEDDFIKMVRAYQKTGLHESTLTTGDYAAMHGLPHGMESIRWIADKGLIFFKEGERWARNYAWIQAWDKVSQGGKLAMTDKLIDEVTRLHLKYTLNLNRANRAFWQKGVLSIPTQFYQISTKFIENMLLSTSNGGAWTGKQKAAILLGQMSLFGAAGVPYGRSMYDSLAKWSQSDEEYGLAITNPRTLTFIQGGLTEMFMYDWTGERYDVTNRLSIPAGIESMIEIIASDQHTAMDTITGVSGEIGTRTWEAIRANARILASIVSDPSTIDASVLTDVLDESAKVVSSYRNYRKAAVYAELGYIEDRYHNKIIPVNDVDNRALLFGQAIGVSPKIVSDYFRIKRFNKNTDQDYRDASNAVITISNKYYGDPDILTNVKKQKRMEAEIAIAMLGFTDEEKSKIVDLVNNKMMKDNYKLPEEMEKAIDNLYNKHGAPDLQSNVTMVAE